MKTYAVQYQVDLIRRQTKQLIKEQPVIKWFTAEFYQTLKELISFLSKLFENIDEGTS